MINAQQQLLRILTHHMIVIAERINLLSADVTEDSLIEDAHRHWDRLTAHEWKAVVVRFPVRNDKISWSWCEDDSGTPDGSAPEVQGYCSTLQCGSCNANVSVSGHEN